MTMAGRSPTNPILAHVAGHLIVETVPPGAFVWVDGALKGRTFADVVVGGGQHDVVLIVPGHRMYRGSVATRSGAIIRRSLAPIAPTTSGSASIRVTCATQGKYPILVDTQETGLLCPSTVAVSAGRHAVGIYVPAQGKIVSVETSAPEGVAPSAAVFAE